MEFEVAIIGGGIAGMSVAGELSRDPSLRVAVLERERQLAYHATGRSAAAFLETYGSPEIRALTRISRPMLDVEMPAVLTPRGLLWLAPAGQVAELESLLGTESALRPVSAAELRVLCPVIKPDWCQLAALEQHAQDLDVAALFEHYRRLARHNGVTIVTGMAVCGAVRDELGWLLRTSTGERVRASVVVNAAGAWADEVARGCGVDAVGLTPLRRTVAIVSSPAVDRSWPLVSNVTEGFYFRPEGDALLLSPADETPSEPVDARAEDVDIALALEQVNEATTLNLRHVRTSWAGLRTFAPDRNPVVGFDPTVPSFFWLAGQGGYGMQTAPALAVLASRLIRGESLPESMAGVDPRRIGPGRFGTCADMSASLSEGSASGGSPSEGSPSTEIDAGIDWRGGDGDADGEVRD